MEDYDENFDVASDSQSRIALLRLLVRSSPSTRDYLAQGLAAPFLQIPILFLPKELGGHAKTAQEPCSGEGVRLPLFAEMHEGIIRVVQVTPPS